MLVLTRRQGESIRINDTMRITLLSSSEKQIRVSLETPRGKAVLNRPSGSTLLNESDINIRVINVHGNVRFSIDAPRSVSIWREEIWLKMHEQVHVPSSIRKIKIAGTFND
ncbi:carbon storage regulator [Endozoicomonas gorgoniicola]|uniref:Carbon storage regulator n=1 Tax=Endozoicomonas gorgoniicola TaxID=1234144 RepID=A0ABT3MW79_9GAMM|nr:carbon storage regulator [Endozoicomonas gorgoniicola]MCW7553627.1 carbon storage regulator [Endozoicomonas gorgoniicola]